MATTEPLTGARIPDLSNTPNIPQDISNAVRDLAPDTVPHFTSTASRDSAYSAWVSAGGAMRDGLECTVGSKKYVYSSTASAWIEMGDAGSWGTFTPAPSAAGGGLNLGTGTAVGRYRKVGRVCHINIVITFQGASATGGTGNIAIAGLPFTSATVTGGQWHLNATAFTTSGTNRNWSGFGYIASNSATVMPHFSNNASPVYWEQARHTSNGSAGTGIPYISGDSPFFSGAVITIDGTYETAS